MSVLSCATVSKNVGVIDSDGMVLIPRGWFYMGYNEGEFNEKPEHEVYVKTFRIDGYEVSAKEFAVFLNEKGNPDDRYFSCDEHSTIICFTKEGKQTVSSSGKDIVRFGPRPGYAHYPANNVSWYGAEGFCRWKGKRLPTEAEWEKAARGDDRRLYPWGDRVPDDLRSRYDKEWEKNGLDVLFPVDALPSGRSGYGVYNMAGNALEWTNDWYRQNYCNFCDPSGADYAAAASEILGLHEAAVADGLNNPDLPPRYDTEGPAVGSFKVLRGGSWYDKSGNKLRSSYRFWLDPVERYDYTGFRCAAAEEYVEQPATQGIVVKVEEVPLVKHEEKIALLPEVQAVEPEPAPVEGPVFGDIYFDFDKDNIRADAELTLKTVADWLLRNRGAVILIEGHCDEQGTNEYNLALGERRANIVREYLMGMGISGERLETTSYGEERPSCREVSSLCWQKNRRAHFVLIKKDTGGPGR